MGGSYFYLSFAWLKFFLNAVSLVFWEQHCGSSLGAALSCTGAGRCPAPDPVSPTCGRGQTTAVVLCHQGGTRAASSTGFALTFEEDDLVVAGSLVDRVQAVQVEWQTPPETVDLSRLEGDQVLIASQSPEVLAWRNRLDITEPHCNPAAWERAPGAREQSVRWERGGTGVLLPGSSC